MSGALIRYDAARKALAEAHRVDEAKVIRDKAIALAAYARQAKDEEMILWATEIKLRAERRTGEMLRETADTPGPGRGKKVSPSDDSFSAKHSDVPTLKALGITRDQSSDWQKLAAIPKEEFEDRLAAASSNPRTMTTERLLRPLPPTKVKSPWEDEARIWAGVSEWLRRARELPDREALKSVKPTGGSRDALRSHLVVARRYMATLAKLRRDGWV